MMSLISHESSDSPISIPQFILLGDSITQCSTLTLQSYLQTVYIRRLDILNRGFSGYTALLGLRMLKRFLPESSLQLGSAKVKVLAIFFGANDSTENLPHLPDNQHVPLKAFVAAITEIANYSVLRAHETKIILITPPPVDEHKLTDPNMRRGRTATNTAMYATAIRNLSRQLRVPLVDCWTIFMLKAGWTDSTVKEDNMPGSANAERNAVLDALMSDGLHLTEAGYKLLYGELIRVIEEELPQIAPSKLSLALEMHDPGFEWERDGASNQLQDPLYPSVNTEIA